MFNHVLTGTQLPYILKTIKTLYEHPKRNIHINPHITFYSRTKHARTILSKIN
ncbi:hypothetical protein Hanom_Chr01g00031601 [Helianthus anomalus]